MHKKRINSLAIALTAALLVLGCRGPSDSQSINQPQKPDDMKRDKVFKLKASEIRDVAPGHGGCIASDMITVQGRKVGFMYREEPAHSADSGWRFLSGDESEAFMDNPDNHGVYDVNTIANYDTDIVPLLDAPTGASFERDGPSGSFVAVQDEMPN